MTTTNQTYRFSLDVKEQRLIGGNREIELAPKAFDMLRYMASNPNRLLSRKELLENVWPDTHVEPELVKHYVGVLRKILGEDPNQPRFIETVRGRGYRFIGPIDIVDSSSSSSLPSSSQTPHPTIVVGRGREIRMLQEYLNRAMSGERQMVFITGEPGIGKTTVVDAFVDQIAPAGVWFTRGQCIDHYGIKEPYLPVLDALEHLCLEDKQQPVLECLNRFAPTWLLQIPGLIDRTQWRALQRETLGATQTRMLREFAAALEEMATRHGLILWLEDLHWSDYATLDLIAYLARRRRPAQLLLLASYRPTEVPELDHPLRKLHRELELHHQCHSLELGLLNEPDVAEYLERRFSITSDVLAQSIHQRTEGNPLFMSNILDRLLAQDIIRRSDEIWTLSNNFRDIGLDFPETLQQMIISRIARLPEAMRQLLEVGSVIGAEFSAATVAAGAGQDVAFVEQQCGQLSVSSSFLRARGSETWPEKTVSARYQFVHALYRDVLYRQISPSRRAQLHRRIGERLESAYGDQTHIISTELAQHFEECRDDLRAIRYLRQATELSLQRNAHWEAGAYLRRAIALLLKQAQTPERDAQELELQLMLGAALTAAYGWASQDVENAYYRAQQLCEQFQDRPQVFSALLHLASGFYIVRAEYAIASKAGQQLLSIAETQDNPDFFLQAYQILGLIAFSKGEPHQAFQYLEQGLQLRDTCSPSDPATLYGLDPVAGSLAFHTFATWTLGRTAQALQYFEQALAAAEQLGHPLTQAFIYSWAALFHHFRRDIDQTLKFARLAIDYANQKDIPFYMAMATFLHGWVLTETGSIEEGITRMEQGLQGWSSAGARQGLPWQYGFLAQAYQKNEQPEKAHQLIDEAFSHMQMTQECACEAELERIKSGIFRHQGNPEQAEHHLYQAIETAKRQQARSWQLRAAIDLYRLKQGQNKTAEVSELLQSIYRDFEADGDNYDLREAEQLLFFSRLK